MAERYCVICGALFYGKRHTVVCSPECREIHGHEYDKENVKVWKKNNPDKAKTQKEKYNNRHRKEINAYHKEYLISHPDVADKCRVNSKEYHKEYKKNNKEKIAQYRRAHKESVRHKHKKLGLVFDMKPSEWDEIYEHFGYACAYCGAEDDHMHRDHFIPMVLGGGYTKGNIVPACPKCNNKKSGKHPLEWLVMRDGGLVTFIHIAQYLEYP